MIATSSLHETVRLWDLKTKSLNKLLSKTSRLSGQVILVLMGGFSLQW